MHTLNSQLSRTLQRIRAITLLVFVLVCTFLPNFTAAGEWPQILGPMRNGIAQNERIAKEWPAAGPKVLWERAVGHGYAGVAVAEKRLVLAHRVGDSTVVEAMSPENGEVFWKREFPTHYMSTIAPDDGPRCVPTIYRGVVYLFDADGGLHALRLSDGTIVWSRLLVKEYDAPEGYFGAGSTPVIDSDRIVVNLGARGAGVIACALADGKTLWQATDEQASYSAPIVVAVEKARFALVVARLNTVALDLATGKERFRLPFGQRGPTVNAATPLMMGDNLFLTANYGIGAVWARLHADSADIQWAEDGVLSSQFTTAIVVGDYLYGIDGRQDAGVAELRCIDPRTKKIMWNEPGFGTGNLLLADGKLLILKIDGELLLVDPNPSGLHKLASARVLSSTAQALPALADGRLYLRDTEKLKALDLR